MKALSYIVASILMLIITVALSGTAYMYIAGVFTGTIQGIEISDAYCSLGEVTLSIRNIGTSPITKLDIEQTNPKDDFLTPSFQGTIEPGKTIQYKDTCEGETARKCMYRITPPAGKTITSDVTCTGTQESLVLSLHFDEGFGLATKDSSGNNNDGVFYGESFNDGELKPNYPTDAPIRVNGKFGKALQFGIDGSTTYPYVSLPDQFNFPNGQPFSISVWFYPTYNPSVQNWGIFYWRIPISNVPRNDLAFYRYTTDATGSNERTSFEWWVNGILYSLSWLPSAGQTFLGAWHHSILVYDGTTAYLYGDGLLRGSINVPQAVLTTSDTYLSISSPNQVFPGYLDEVRIYNRVLTEEEIQAEMQSSIPVARTVASYSFEDTDMPGYANDTHIWIKGKYGSALSFDGVNDYVYAGQTSSFLGASGFSISMWVNYAGNPNGCAVITGAINASNIVPRFGIDSGCFNRYPYIFLTNYTGQEWNAGNPFALLTNQWYHIVGIWNPSLSTNNLILYINGDQTSVTTAPTTILPLINPYLYISGWAGVFNGTIDEVRIYNKALI